MKQVTGSQRREVQGIMQIRRETTDSYQYTDTYLLDVNETE